MPVFFLSKNRLPTVIILVIIIFFAWKTFFPKEKRVLGLSSQAKEIIVNDNGLYQKIKTNADSVQDFLKEQNITLTENDFIFPDKQAPLYTGIKIQINRAKSATLTIDKQETKLFGFKNTVKDFLQENNIDFKNEDIIKPSRNDIVYNNMDIEIIRVENKEEIVNKKIPFKTIYKEDDKLSWRKEKIKQKGATGIEEIKYLVSYHNGEKVSQKKISETVKKEPVPKIVVKGAYIKFGKTHKGVASWYAHTGTMSAANPWLPMGSYVKVTNLDNGKSVIVKINDRGPFGNGRIIDLDKVAFAKIANLGQGTARIKMEEILN